VSRSEAIQLVELLAIIAFVVGLKRLSHPATARSGNTIAAAGMLAAIAATLADEGVVSYAAIAGAMAVGGIIGLVSARAVKMTAMPQMVALFNGVGGGGAALIALAEYHRLVPEPGRAALAETIAIALSLVIGAISFAGSLVAFAKLQELIGGRPLTYPGQKAVNGLIAVAVVVLAASISFSDSESRLVAAGVLALLLGVLFVLPIGGADMPVVISLLNSFTGIAAAASGFVLHNDLLIVSGSLVGASGTLLTRMMGQAMNRPLTNVLCRSGREQRQRALARSRRCRRAAGLRQPSRVRPGLRSRRRPGAARRTRAGRPARGEAHRRPLRHPPRRRAHAGAHERAAGRGRRSVSAALRDGAHQSGVPPYRRRARGRRQ
jgi:proton-translocating NAD(P)+ transhydrogenase subunit beta